MNGRPAVSVVIPTHNRAALLRETLASVLAQTVEDIEVIVVDNGSTDDTAEVVAAPGDRRVRYQYQANSGSPVGPRNTGIRQARAELVALVDSDDLWLPDRLERQLEQMRSDERLVMSYTECRLIDARGRELGWQSHYAAPHAGEVFGPLLRQNFIANSSVVVKKTALVGEDLFDPQYLIAHDLDMWLKIARRGRVGYLPEPLTKLRMHDGGFGEDALQVRHEIVRILEGWASRVESPQDRATVRRALSRQEVLLGIDLTVLGDRRAAGRSFRKAVAHSWANSVAGPALVAHALARPIPGGLLQRALLRVMRGRRLRMPKSARTMSARAL